MDVLYWILLSVGFGMIAWSIIEEIRYKKYNKPVGALIIQKDLEDGEQYMSLRLECDLKDLDGRISIIVNVEHVASNSAD